MATMAAASASARIAHVESNEISSLMYYLFCVTKSCGLEVLSNDLVDYSNYLVVSKDKKRVEAILTNALQYSPETLNGKWMFPDDGYNLCGDKSNMFLPISRAQAYVNVQPSISIDGQVMTITSVLFYKADWLKGYYHQPMASNKSLVKRLRSRLSVPSPPASAGVNGGAPSRIKFGHKPSRPSSVGTSTDSSGSGRIFSFLTSQSPSSSSSPQQSQSDVSIPTGKAPSKHCKHCDGNKKKCTCKFRCPLVEASLCFGEHTGVTCNLCGMSPIQGSRLKCAECSNFELCASCYNRSGKHLSHPFRHIPRPGHMYNTLPARAKEQSQHRPSSAKGTSAPVAKPVVSKHCGHCPGDMGICRCNYACTLSQEGRCYTLHNVPCGICKSPTISGPLYKCKECVNFNICQNCYGMTGGGQAHAMHGFLQYIQKRTMPTVLPPCVTSPRIVQPRGSPQRVLAMPQIPMTPPSPISPEFTNSPYSLPPTGSMAMLSPFSLPQQQAGPFSPGGVQAEMGTAGFSPGGHVDLAMAEVSGSEKGTMMTDNMTKTQMIAFLMTHGEQASGAETQDELRHRVWDCHVDCIGVPELSRLLVNLGLDETGLSVSQRRQHAKAAYSSRYNTGFSSPLNPAHAAMPQTPGGSAAFGDDGPYLAVKSPDFSKGDQVSLHGLRTASHRNGKQGVIVDGMLWQGRINVRLDDDDAVVSAKLENLKLEAQVVD